MFKLNIGKSRSLPVIALLAAATLQVDGARAGEPPRGAQAQAAALLLSSPEAGSSDEVGKIAPAAGAWLPGQRAALDVQAQARRIMVGERGTLAHSPGQSPVVVSLDLNAARTGAMDAQRRAQELLLGHGA